MRLSVLCFCLLNTFLVVDLTVIFRGIWMNLPVSSGFFCLGVVLGWWGRVRLRLGRLCRVGVIG